MRRTVRLLRTRGSACFAVSLLFLALIEVGMGAFLIGFFVMAPVSQVMAMALFRPLLGIEDVKPSLD